MSTSPLVARTGRDLQRYSADGARQTAGCIPWRRADNGIEVLTLTKRRGPGARVFPKGGWETDEGAAEAATRECLEEAGVSGSDVRALGSYRFNSKSNSTCDVHMFALEVTEELDDWPEKHERQRQWFPLAAAFAEVDGWAVEALGALRDHLNQ